MLRISRALALVALLAVVFTTTARAARDLPNATFTSPYDGGTWTLAFDKGLMTITHNGQQVVVAAYKSDGDEVTIADVHGPMAQVAVESNGTYKWKYGDGELKFEVVQDQTWRVKLLTSGPWKRK